MRDNNNEGIPEEVLVAAIRSVGVECVAERDRNNKGILRVGLVCPVLLSMTGQFKAGYDVVLSHIPDEDGIVQVFVEPMAEYFECQQLCGRRLTHAVWLDLATYVIRIGLHPPAEELSKFLERSIAANLYGDL